MKLIGDITESHFYSSSEVPTPDQVVYKRLSIRWVFNNRNKELFDYRIE